MSSPEPHWIEKVTRRVLSLFSIKEVKTPLSFFFRTTSAIVVLAVGSLLWLDPAYRFKALLGAAALLMVLIVTVSLFAWFKPKNLVYGETGHRAETKLSFGTDKGEVSAAALAATPGVPNPHPLPATGTFGSLPEESERA